MLSKELLVLPAVGALNLARWQSVFSRFIVQKTMIGPEWFHRLKPALVIRFW
jgi:hypothetical protein